MAPANFSTDLVDLCIAHLLLFQKITCSSDFFIFSSEACSIFYSFGGCLDCSSAIPFKKINQTSRISGFACDTLVIF